MAILNKIKKKRVSIISLYTCWVKFITVTSLIAAIELGQKWPKMLTSTVLYPKVIVYILRLMHHMRIPYYVLSPMGM